MLPRASFLGSISQLTVWLRPGLCGARVMVGEAGPRSRNGGCDTRYLCEGFREQSRLHMQKPLSSSSWSLVLTSSVPTPPGAHTLTQTHTRPPTYVPISVGPRLSLSSSCRSFFPQPLSSLLGRKVGREGLGCGLCLPSQSVAVRLFKMGSVQEAIAIFPSEREVPARGVGYWLGSLSP